MMSGHEQTICVLRDGREMVVRNALIEDVPRIAAAFPLPEHMMAPEDVYRRYFEVKTLIYVRADVADITCGFVDEELAGYQFYCRDLTALQRFTTSPGTIGWLLGEAARGRFSYSPGYWLTCARWAGQHFRQPGKYRETRGALPVDCQTLRAWSRGVRTVDSFQRLGVASQLMAHPEGVLTGARVDRIALWTSVSNDPAISLFEKRGFVRRIRVSRIGEDCWLMVKTLQTE